MKKYIHCIAAMLLGAFTLAACDDGDFGGDYKVEGVKLQEMCGTWTCTVEANDPWFTVNYYSNDYDPAFLLGYFGEPYGTTNPDANPDGLVDGKDFELYTAQGLWADEVGESVTFHTANTAADNTTEMIVSDQGIFGNGSQPYNFKVNVDCEAKTFSVGKVVEEPYEALMVEPVTIGRTYSNGEDAVVLGGKVMPGAATAPGSKMKTDSIVFYVKYPGDFGQDIYYRVSGYRTTGYAEDQ